MTASQDTARLNRLEALLDKHGYLEVTLYMSGSIMLTVDREDHEADDLRTLLDLPRVIALTTP